MNLRHSGELLFLGAIWGSAFLFTRVAVAEFGPLALIELRLAVASLVLAIPMIIVGGWKPFRQHWKALFVQGALNCAIPFCLFAYAMMSVTAGVASVLNATAPLFGALLGATLLGDTISRRKALGLVIGFIGVLLLVGDQLGFDGSIIPILSGMTAALLYGVAAHQNRYYLREVPPVVISGGSLFFAALMLLPLALFQLPSEVPSTVAWLSAIGLGVFCSALAYLMYFRLLPKIGLPRAMTVAYLVPVFGIFWGFTLLGEPVTLRTIGGAAVVLLGTTLVNLPQRPVPTPAVEAPVESA